MTQSRYNPAIKPASPTDSAFGMALAQAFMGGVFGIGVDMGWETGEIASAMREDRRTSGQGNYELGVKNSLAGDFSRFSSEQSPAEFEAAYYRRPQPAMAPSYV